MALISATLDGIKLPSTILTIRSKNIYFMNANTLKRRLYKFHTANSEYFRTHKFSYHIFYKQNELDLWTAIKDFGGAKGVRKLLGIDLLTRHNILTEKQILVQLKKLRRSGVAITKKGITDAGRSDLLSNMRKIGPLSYFKRKFRLKVVEKIRRTKNEVLQKYQSIYLSTGKVPTGPYLKKMGFSWLLSAIRTTYGGIGKIQKKLKLSSPKTCNGYWTESRTVLALKKYVRQHASAINQSSICRVLLNGKEYSLYNAIQKWGGLHKLNNTYNLNLPVIGQKWTREKIIILLRDLHNKGHSLSNKNLRRIGYSDLAGNIPRFGTLTEFRTLLGAKGRRYNYWNEKKVKSELKVLTDQYGCIPSQQLMRSLGKHDLIAAMRKLGGVHKFSRLLKVAIKRLYKANDGHYLQSSYECIFDNILFKYGIPHTTHNYIVNNRKYKCDFLISDTYIEIAGFVRKGDPTYINNLRRKLKIYTQLKKKCIVISGEVFKNVNKVEERILSILKTIPNIKYGIKQSQMPSGIFPPSHWSKIRNVRKELVPLIKKYDRMPTYRELAKEGKYSLIKGIKLYHTSLFALALSWKIKVKQIGRGFYTFKMIVKKYKEICVSKTQFLTLKDISIVDVNLARAIANKWSIIEIRKACRIKLPNIGYKGNSVRYTFKKACKEYKTLCIQHNRYLSRREIKELGNNRLANIRYNITQIRNSIKLPFDYNILPKGFYTVKKATKIYKKACKEKGYFMTIRESLDVLPQKLVKFMERNRGIEEYRRLTDLNYSVNKKKQARLTIQQAVRAYRSICIKEQYLVTMTALVSMGEGKLARFILHEIGYPEIREKIRVDLPLKSPEYLKNLARKCLESQIRKRMIAKSEYVRLCVKYNRILSLAELRDLEQKSIMTAIRQFKSISEFREECKGLEALAPCVRGRRVWQHLKYA